MALGRLARVLEPRRYALWAVLAALALWAGAWLLGARRPEPDLLPFLKRAFPFADYRQTAPGTYRVSRAGEWVGWGAAGSATGYGGAVTVALASDVTGTVRAAALLEYRDTPGLGGSMQPLLASLAGRGVETPLAIGEDLDAVTGATFSSGGVAAAARAAAERIVGRPREARRGPAFGAPEAAVVLLFATAWLARHRRRLSPQARSLLRSLVLLASLATLGFLWNRPWVIAFPARLAAGDWPSLPGHLYWYLLLLALLVGFDRSGRSPWCPWLCPFGAAQDLVGLAGGARRRRLGARRFFLAAKTLLLVAAVASALAFRSPAAASFEVFAALFRGRGSPQQVAVLVFVGLAALVVSRPFCHWLCPVDVLERTLGGLRRRLFGTRRKGLRTTLLPVVPVELPAGPLRRLRDRVLTAVGVFCLALVIVHLVSAFRAVSAGNQFGLMSETYVAAQAAP